MSGKYFVLLKEVLSKALDLLDVRRKTQHCKIGVLLKIGIFRDLDPMKTVGSGNGIKNQSGISNIRS